MHHFIKDLTYTLGPYNLSFVNKTDFYDYKK